MRSLLKISLAVLAVGFLVVAGSAFAQEMAKPTMTITGNIGTAFGQATYDKTNDSPASGTQPLNQKGFSEYVTSWESNIRFTWQTDTIQLISRARIRANNEGSGSGTGSLASGTQSGGTAFGSSADDWYNEAWWTPGAFKLGIGKFQGQAWSQPLSGSYIIINPVEVAGGASEYWMNWTGISGLDAEYNAGVVQVGVALSSQCKPSCGFGVPTNSTSRTFVNTSSLTPHVTGAVGPISFRAQFPQTQGTIQNTSGGTPAGTTPLNNGAGGDPGESKTTSGSGLQAGVSFSQSGLVVAADYSTFTDSKVTDLGLVQLDGVSAGKDRTRTGESVRVDIPAGPGSATIAYFTIDDNIPAASLICSNTGVCSAAGSNPTNVGGTNKTFTSTLLTARYNYPISFAVLTFEYRAATVGGGIIPATPASGPTGTPKDAQNSEFRVILNGGF